MLCDDDLQARHALPAHRASLAKFAKLSPTRVGWCGFDSGWLVNFVLSMGLQGRVRMKLKQTAGLLLHPLRKQLDLPGRTSHHAPYKAFVIVAWLPAARSQALPAPHPCLSQALPSET